MWRSSASAGPTPENRKAFAEAVVAQDLGDCAACDSLEDLLAIPDLDAVWILSPNHTRLATMEVIANAVSSGKSTVRAVACEKPLARTVKEARQMLALAEGAGLLHGYLENQLFSTAVERGKEIIWRRAVPATAGLIWRGRPKSIPGRTSRGSGKETCKAAACCWT